MTPQMSECLVKDYEWLSAKSKEGKLCWTGTMTDLCVWTHHLFSQFALSDAQGRPRRYVSLMREVCEMLGRQMPVNPYSFLYMALTEDSSWRKTFKTRYQDIFLSGEEHPVSRFVKSDLHN